MATNRFKVTYVILNKTYNPGDEYPYVELAVQDYDLFNDANLFKDAIVDAQLLIAKERQLLPTEYSVVSIKAIPNIVRGVPYLPQIAVHQNKP